MKRSVLQTYFRSTTDTESAVEWRLRCYDAGRKFADKLPDVRGKTVLDMAAGWGGHALAFAERGAHVVASDLNDHGYTRLNEFAAAHDLSLHAQLGDCQHLPFSDHSFDTILALDLIEHIPEPERMAREITRLLKPGGVCFLTTPPKLLSAVWGEPHWQLKGLSLLPFAWQRLIATRLFKRNYPFPIERQYLFSRQVTTLFKDLHCVAVPATRKLPWAQLFWGHFQLTKA